jgi:hypothetical protein
MSPCLMVWIWFGQFDCHHAMFLHERRLNLIYLTTFNICDNQVGHFLHSSTVSNFSSACDGVKSSSGDGHFHNSMHATMIQPSRNHKVIPSLTRLEPFSSVLRLSSLPKLLQHSHVWASHEKRNLNVQKSEHGVFFYNVDFFPAIWGSVRDQSSQSVRMMHPTSGDVIIDTLN